MNKLVVVVAGGTIGGAAGAVLLTGLSFALFPIPTLAAISFGVGLAGGVVGGVTGTGKIYDKVIREHVEIDETALDMVDTIEYTESDIEQDSGRDR